MSKRVLAAIGAGAAAAAVSVGIGPIADAQPGDGGVCVRKNGQPFYIPAQGYMPLPGEVITGPVTAGPCQESSSAPPEAPSLPSFPDTAPTSSTSPTEPPPPPAP